MSGNIKKEETMITEKNGLFVLNTNELTYAFKVGKCGQMEQVYFGRKTELHDPQASQVKNNLIIGSSVNYSEEHSDYNLDLHTLEYSGIGKGDYRHTPLEVKMPDGSFVTDFVYSGYKIVNDAPDDLPCAYGSSETLVITLTDKKYSGVSLELCYTVFEDCDCVCRFVRIRNDGEQIIIRKIMSLMLDLPPCDYELVTLDGGWAKEAHEHSREVTYGIAVNDSTTGDSSNRHNPAFMLKEKGASLDSGSVIGVNLIYSGNHYSAVEKSNHGLIRLMTGINPHCFEWTLARGESFCTPQAVITKSLCGTNGLIKNMHEFVNNHIVRGEWRDKERPILFNHWEAFFFDFNKRKIAALASRAAKLGGELFVLDDGWFSTRNNDVSGLGDYNVNTKKLPGGLGALAKKINKLGMKFGLWFEPECVNTDSDLYRAHPEYAITVPDRTPSSGRHQLVLDLTNRDVRDYIVNSVNATLASANIEYVKWDYNRHISDAYSPQLKEQGRFFHEYILGLYDVFDRVTKANPSVLFESCSSGGNRFDLGLLCYTPQIWVSDDTDPIERLDIQGGLINFYPQSTFGAHVSASPSQQTLRSTNISTRFNVAAFGAFGYELDLSELCAFDLKEIKEQIAFYKQHRKTFQFGKFRKGATTRDNRISWQVYAENETIAAEYQTVCHASPDFDVLKVPNLRGKFRMTTKGQHVKLSRFGGLIKHVLPVRIKPDSALFAILASHYRLADGVEDYTVTGEQLEEGVPLSMQFMGSWYDPSTRLLSDFGSQLYVIDKIE